MDFIDPKNRLRQTILLIIGYILITIAIILATVILLYQAYGFGIGKNGTIIQNSLVFFSSQPNPANIYLNGKLNPSQTNTRIVLPAGSYNVKIALKSYHAWRRTVNLQGGMVEHFDYPFLFPTHLNNKIIASFNGNPAFVSQSPNQRWLLVDNPTAVDTFLLYDLNHPTRAPQTISLPSNLFTKANISDSWKVISWANDNQHVLLEHLYDGKIEYIMLNTANASQSINLSQALAANSFSRISLANKNYNQYFLYNASSGTLSLAALGSPSASKVLSHVIAYKTYGTNTVLYMTAHGAPAGKVYVREQIGSTIYTIRTIKAASSYLLNTTTYNGVPYVVFGATSSNELYIYHDPVGQLSDNPNQIPVPIQVLHVNNANYLSFSQNAQIIVAENGKQFSTYNIQNSHGYNYISSQALQAPAIHAEWMDGDRLMYVSNGKLVVFDYDHNNVRTLMPTMPQYKPAFSANYNFVYTLAPGLKSTKPVTNLVQTSLLANVP